MSRRLPILLLAAALCATPVRAQTPQANALSRGFGFGYGSFACWKSFTCDHRSLSAYADIDKAISAQLLAGFQLNGWLVDRGIRMGAASAVLSFRPLRRGGLRFKGTLGLSAVKPASEDDMGYSLEFGGAASFGVAYDIPLSPSMSLSSGINVVGTTPVGSIFDESRNMWQLLIGLTWF